MKVFISSTYLDLIEHRKAVVNALRTMDEEVGHMEVFGARDDEAITVSLEELDKCDVLVGVYAYRYGTVPTGSKASVTEQEYLHAMSKKIPILVFVVNESHPWPPKSMDKSLIKISKFKSKATNEHTPDYFTSPDNLAHKVVSSIGRLAKKLSPKPSVLDSRLPTAEHHKPTGSTLPSQAYFFGRERERATIADAISPDSRTWGALIDGPGGIGKTALAIRAAHLAPTSLFERKLFITAKVRELTPEGEKPLIDFARDNYFSMLNELALELGEEGIPRLAPDERANQLRMALVGKKTLIVFDNLETLSEDERTRLFQFLSRLPEGNKAIVTSRRRADIDARVIRLDRLSADEALQLMKELTKNNHRLAREDEKARRDLYEITNGNPLLIKWVCGQLGREGSAMYTIAEACKFIENSSEGNDPLEYIFGDLLETFAESETKVLAALTHFTQPAKLKWIVEMTGLVEQVAKTALDDLTDRSILITNNEVREFFLPPLASLFIRTHRPEVVADTGNALSNRAYELIELYSGKSNYDGYRILNSEWLSIETAIPSLLLRDNENAQLFRKSLEKFFRFTGRYDEAIDIYRQAEQKALFMNNLYDAGWCAFDLGWIYYLRGEVHDVMECANRADTFWLNAGDYEKSFSALLRGMEYKLKKNYPEASIYIQKSIDLRKSLNLTSQEVAIALNDLAQLERESGDFNAAEKHYQEALRIDELNNSYEGTATRTGNLAELALDREQWTKAKNLAYKSLEMAEKIGRQELIAKNSRRIALALYHLGAPIEALPLAKRAFDIFTTLRYKDLPKAKETLSKIEQAIQKQSNNQ